MSNWLDNIINKAREEGHFDNLPGQGKPLDLNRDAHEDPAMQLANHILKENGFVWPWIEERKEIEEAVEKAVAELLAARRAGQPVWTQATAAFRQKAADLNRKIAAHNLAVPSLTFHRAPINVEAEIERATREP
jgi:DnaJ family protein C protein 28